MSSLIDHIARIHTESSSAQAHADADPVEVDDAPVSFKDNRTEDRPTEWTLPEELYLLCIDPETGNHQLGDAAITMAIAAELALRNRISIEANESVKLRDITRTGDSTLDQALEHLVSVPSRDGSSSVSIWSAFGEPTFSTIRDKLRSMGILEYSQRSSWIFFTTERYSVTPASTQNDIRLRFARAIERGGTRGTSKAFVRSMHPPVARAKIPHSPWVMQRSLPLRACG
jgi:hypothetical protein